jgi:hypothetical protein
MLRFLLGVGVGAALIYYLDVERGADRRAQANAWARQYVNSDTIEQARQSTMNQARAISDQVKQGANQVSDRVSQYRTSRRSASTPKEQQPVGVDSLNGATVGVEQP